MASTDARPVPIKNTAYRLTFPIYKSDGTLITGAAGLDSEVSKDAGTFADCTNEATEIATSSGVYYLDVTSTEMNADCSVVLVKSSTTGAVPVVFVLYPQESGDIKVDVQSAAGTAWASGAITAASVADDVSTEIRDKIVLRTTLRGTVSTSSSTTSITTSAMSPATSAADQLKGRIVIFDHDTTTAALRGAATDITASSASATPTLTVSALPATPASGDTFTVV